MSDWKSVSEAWPDWPDTGRRVEICREDGTTQEGTLFVEDFFPTGDGDEVPVFALRADDAVTYSFCDAVRWRFV